jgi:hypothetical protein
MSLVKSPFHKKTSFTTSKSTPRKMMSHSPFKYSAEDLARELGPNYQTVDVRIGNQRMILDTIQGGWVLGNF